jgi:arginase family enzyme
LTGEQVALTGVPTTGSLVTPPSGYEPGAGAVVLLGAPAPCPPDRAGAPALIRRGLAKLSRPGAHPRVSDLGDVAPDPIALQRPVLAPPPLQVVEEPAAQLFAAGARPIFAAADHSITDHALRGLFRGRRGLRIAVIVLDAHLDVREFMDDGALCSTAPFSRAMEAGACRGSSTAVVGLTHDGNSRIVTDWYREGGCHLFLVDDVIRQDPVETATHVLQAVLRDADVLYLSVDLDVIGSPECGSQGIPEEHTLALLATLADSPALAGADIVGAVPHGSAAQEEFAARTFLTLAGKLSAR